jgi:hypothetical protein
MSRQTWWRHQHGQNIVGSENSSLVLVGKLLQDWVAGGGDVVGGALENVEFPLGCLRARLLVVAAVVVVEEAIVLEILAISSVEVQLSQTREVNLLHDLPLRLDLNRRITVTLGLVVPPAEAASSSASTTATAAVILLSATATNTLEGTPSSTLCWSTPLSSSTSEDGAASASESSSAGRCACVVDDGEGSLLFGGLNGEGVGLLVCAVHLLVCGVVVRYLLYRLSAHMPSSYIPR